MPVGWLKTSQVESIEVTELTGRGDVGEVQGADGVGGERRTSRRPWVLPIQVVAQGIGVHGEDCRRRAGGRWRGCS